MVEKPEFISETSQVEDEVHNVDGKRLRKKLLWKLDTR